MTPSLMNALLARAMTDLHNVRRWLTGPDEGSKAASRHLAAAIMSLMRAEAHVELLGTDDEDEGDGEDGAEEAETKALGAVGDEEERQEEGEGG